MVRKHKGRINLSQRASSTDKVSGAYTPHHHSSIVHLWRNRFCTSLGSSFFEMGQLRLEQGHWANRCDSVFFDFECTQAVNGDTDNFPQVKQNSAKLSGPGVGKQEAYFF